ncbi:MAG: hypothetical protein M1118_14570 [Chloroflexi bacterium]|nr:hypothetical protein [Chloroflexota bacterium]
MTVQSRDHCTVHFGGFRSALTALTSHSSVVKVRLRFHAGSLLYRSGSSSVKTLLREFSPSSCFVTAAFAAEQQSSVSPAGMQQAGGNVASPPLAHP